MLTTAQQNQVLSYISDICISREGTSKVTQLIGLGAVTCFKIIRDFRRGKIIQQPNTTKFDPGIFRSIALELTTCSTFLLEKLIVADFFEHFARFVRTLCD
jgi:hypothetical protein